MIKETIARLVPGTYHLDEQEMIAVMEEIMTGQATDAQIGALLMALRIKGESIDEITGAARVMREKATFVDTGIDTAGGEILLDIVGTGGDGAGTFNVSTTSAFVVAAAGIPVAKHGNRAVSSHCGSADVLEALGADLTLSPEQVGRCVRSVGMGFLFAPALHGAMKYAIGPRREMGIRTIFNILGPLTNPARTNVQVVGVFSKQLMYTVAEVLMRLGMRRALVVWGEGNLDELTVTGNSHMVEVRPGGQVYSTVSPEDLGLSPARLEDIRGGSSAAESAQQVREVLAGQPGARLDTVLLNAGAALMLADKAEDLKEGIALARELILSGAALQKLDDFVAFCAREKSQSL